MKRRVTIRAGLPGSTVRRELIVWLGDLPVMTALVYIDGTFIAWRSTYDVNGHRAENLSSRQVADFMGWGKGFAGAGK